MRLRSNQRVISSEAGQLIVSELPAELSAEPDSLGQGLFLQARAALTASRWVFGLGRLAELERFTACHRYEPYWMRPAVGSRLRDVPPETQFLLARRKDGLLVLLVPLVSEPFRFSLRGGTDDTLSLVAETGDAFTAGHGGLAAYLAVGEDAYELVRRSAREVAARLGISKLRRDKPIPDFVDGFGWCTWDAFYQDVSAEKVLAGLERFRAGGVSPRFLILDDGWQSVSRRSTGETRLTAFAANQKFPGGLAALVTTAKRRFGLRHFLVWHAVVGYWGGVDGEALPGYGVRDQPRQFGEGILAHVPSFNHDWWGSLVGLVPAESVARFYDDYHAELAAAGVDGVKVDSQAVLEALAHGAGGRVRLSRAYRAALEASASLRFEGRLINCMSNAQETWYGSPNSTLIRSSIDFFPARPESHGAHLFANAQVGLWFGEFMQPDWDMFQSGHAWGEYHAAARALSGGPVYVSDTPGEHDFALLRRLVCSDGSVLRCDDVGRPTPDSLFCDPTREAVAMKIFNRNGVAGFVGAFNAHAGLDGAPAPIVSASLGPADVPGLPGQRFACYFHVSRELESLDAGQRRPLSLGERSFELASVVPIVDGFAAIGLIDKFNSVAAIRSARASVTQHALELRDGGVFLAYSEREPSAVQLGGVAQPFTYDVATRALRVELPGPGLLEIRLHD